MQELIYGILLDHFPKTRCIGEEGDSNNPGDPKAEHEWIVDPIDGTMNLAMGIPHFCVSIAAREAATRRIILGVIYDPLRRELFTAERGSGTYLNGVRQKVSTRSKLSEAVLAVGFAKDAGVDRSLPEALPGSMAAPPASCAQWDRRRWIWPMSRAGGWMRTSSRA